ncbi:hypothetical protein THAOC_37671, partial [Thalassiosira oceanica]
ARIASRYIEPRPTQTGSAFGVLFFPSIYDVASQQSPYHAEIGGPIGIVKSEFYPPRAMMPVHRSIGRVVVDVSLRYQELRSSLCLGRTVDIRHEHAPHGVAVERPTELRRRKTNGAPAGGGREEEDTPYDGAASTKTSSTKDQRSYGVERPTELPPGAVAKKKTLRMMGRRQPRPPQLLPGRGSRQARPGDSIPEKPGAGAVGRSGVGVAGAGAGAVGVSLGWAVGICFIYMSEDPTHSCVRCKWERKIRMHRGTDRVQK